MSQDLKQLLKDNIQRELTNTEIELEEMIVTTKHAIDLHRIGFNESCYTYFGEVNGGELWPFQRNFSEKEFKLGFLAPAYSQAFEFISRVYAIRGYTAHADSNGTWNFKIHKWNFNNNVGQWEFISNISSYKTKRLAEIACMAKLVELVDERIKEVAL
jgi:hypothetical protein